jgi:hypothetical protein
METPAADYFDYPDLSRSTAEASPICGVPLEYLGAKKLLPVRAVKVLQRMGCRSLQDVSRYSEQHVFAMRGAGEFVVGRIRIQLRNCGLSFDPNSRLPVPEDE